MKKALTLIVFLSFSFAIISQNLVITCDKNNVLYIGVDNPISVAAVNYPPDQIIVNADHGTLEGSGWRYFYRGTEPGSVWITVYKKSNLEKIGSWVFRLKYIPDPVPKIGGYSNSKSNARAIVLKDQLLRADLEDFDYSASFFIDSFTLNVFYHDSCIAKEITSAGRKFNDKVFEALKSTKAGDIVMFKNIYVVGPDKRRRLISPLVLTITD